MPIQLSYIFIIALYSIPSDLNRLNQPQQLYKLLMIQERKSIKSYSQMLFAYQSSCNKISSRYSQQMSKITQESIRTLYGLFKNYLEQKESQQSNCQYTKANSTQESSMKESNPNDSKIYQQTSFCPTSYKKKQWKKDKPNLIIFKQISQLSLDSDVDDEENEEDSPTKKLVYNQDIKNKNLADMILESECKVKQKLQMNKNQLNVELSNSEYELTDYSSNQSSNDGSYSPYYNQQTENKSLFGGLFSKSISSQTNSNSGSSNLLNFSFSSKQLLKSPKKNAKSKRLFIGTKKIPRWAEDLAEIQKISSKQNKTPCTIFGKCVVQNLDTNIIFQGKQEGIKRSSSAKWNSQIFLT